MAAELFIPPSKALDANANPYAGAKWFFYATGTLTPQSVFTTAALSTPHSNPVVADSTGKFANIFFNPSLVYRGILKDSTEAVTLHDIDPVNTELTSLLGGSSGSSLVGWIQTGTGAVARTAQSKMREASISVDDFGAVGNGVADDTPSVVAAQEALIAQGGGELLFTRGKTYLFGPITMGSGVTYKGTGKSGINRVANASGAKLIPFGTSLFTNAATTIDEVRFENLFFYSPDARNAHIFDWTKAGVVAKIQFTGCVAVQENGDKSVIYGNAGGGVFSLYWSDGEWQYVDGATVSPISIVSPTVNSVVFENFWSTAAGQASASGVYAIYIESANPAGPAINVIIRDGVFEFSKHGAVKLVSCVQSGIDNCTSYDLSATPTAPMFFIGDGASAPPSNNCWMKGLRSRTGTVAAPDAKLDCAVSGQASFIVEACSFGYLDGGAATPGILLIGGDIGTFQNIAYTRLGASAGLDLHFGTTDAAAKSITLANGYTGDGPGYFNINRDGAYAGAIGPNAVFQWGGTRANPSFYVDGAGEIRTKQPLYPPDGAGAFQSGTSLIAGAGVPAAGLGTNGQFYFRSDGGGAGATHLYFKTGGAWIAIA